MTTTAAPWPRAAGAVLSRRAALVGLGGLATSTTTLMGCASTTHRGTPDRPMDKVRYATGLGATGREVYAMVALQKGFFRQQDIDVSIVLGEAGQDNTALLRTGTVQFAVIDFASSVIRQGRGAGGDPRGDDSYRVVAAICQRSIIAIISLAGRGVSRPQDLMERTVGVAAQAAPQTLFPLYASQAGMSRADIARVRFVQMSGNQLIPALVTRQVDAIGQFIPAVPSVEAAAKGPQAMVMPYGTYLTDLYGNVLVTSQHLLDSDPGLVRRFSTALLQGLQYTLDNPDEAGKILHGMYPAADPVLAAREVVAMGPYCLGARKLGLIDSTRVARGIAIIKGGGLFPESTTLSPEQVADLRFV